MADKSVWETLSVIDVSKHIEEKNGLKYLSWAWAWATLKDHYPDATFEKHYDSPTGLPFMRDPVSKTAFVSCSVSAGGVTVTEMYPVLDHANKAVQDPTAFHVNSAMQRCLAKCIAYLGLGLYIYAGEDLPPLSKTAQIHHADGSKEEVTGVELIYSVFENCMPLQDNMVELEAFWKNNTQALYVLKEHAPHLFEKVLAKFKKRKEEVANAE